MAAGQEPRADVGAPDPRRGDEGAEKKEEELYLICSLTVLGNWSNDSASSTYSFLRMEKIRKKIINAKRAQSADLEILLEVINGFLVHSGILHSELLFH